MNGAARSGLYAPEMEREARNRLAPVEVAVEQLVEAPVRLRVELVRARARVSGAIAA